jgi:hypothetical protein
VAYVARTLRDSFTPLRLPNLRTYLIGQAISLLGTWMQVTAQGWLVWELSHSEVALGIVSMLGSLPLLLFGLWAGVWAIGSTGARSSSAQQARDDPAFILAALVWTHTVQPASLCAASCWDVSARSIFQPSRLFSAICPA